MNLQRVALMLFALLLLASCGTVISGSSRIGSATAIPSMPTTLHVIRPAINQYLSLDRTVQDTPAVQRLYRAAHALPISPSTEIWNCPMDNGMIYYLTFLQGTIPLQQMTLSATGCQDLRLGQNGGGRLTTEAFRSLFLQTVGIPSLVPEVL